MDILGPNQFVLICTNQRLSGHGRDGGEMAHKRRISISSLARPWSRGLRHPSANIQVTQRRRRELAWHPSLSVRLGAGLSSCYFSLCVVWECVYSTQALFPASESWWISNGVSPCGRRALHPRQFPRLPRQKTLHRGCRLSGMLSEGLGTNMQQRGGKNSSLSQTSVGISRERKRWGWKCYAQEKGMHYGSVNSPEEKLQRQRRNLLTLSLLIKQLQHRVKCHFISFNCEGTVNTNTVVFSFASAEAKC